MYGVEIGEAGDEVPGCLLAFALELQVEYFTWYIVDLEVRRRLFDGRFGRWRFIEAIIDPLEHMNIIELN
jgi:hypothetical protein